MRRAAAVSLAGVALSAVPAAASATSRFEVRVRVNTSRVDAGTPVRVRLVVYAVTNAGRVLSDTPRFHLVAISPAGDRVAVGLRHVGRGTWSGAIRLRVVGRWRIRVSDWRSAGKAPAVTVRVREPAPEPSP
jgi:hypothetical protein